MTVTDERVFFPEKMSERESPETLALFSDPQWIGEGCTAQMHVAHLMAVELTERRARDAPAAELTGLRERLEYVANYPAATIPEEIEAVCDLAATAIVELAERRERERWIPVSERLPDDGYVLGWFPGCGRPGMFFCSTVRHWQNDADPMPGALWRPLPEPTDA